MVLARRRRADDPLGGDRRRAVDCGLRPVPAAVAMKSGDVGTVRRHEVSVGLAWCDPLRRDCVRADIPSRHRTRTIDMVCPRSRLGIHLAAVLSAVAVAIFGVPAVPVHAAMPSWNGKYSLVRYAVQKSGTSVAAS